MRAIRKMRAAALKSTESNFCAAAAVFLSVHTCFAPFRQRSMECIAGVWERRVSAGCGLTWQHQRTPPLTHTRERHRGRQTREKTWRRTREVGHRNIQQEMK